jgi:hypothetical protein
MDPPTIPHMTRHGTKARSTWAATDNAVLCTVNAKYVAPIEAIDDVVKTVIFLLVLILELHDIIVSSCLVETIV